MHRYATKKLEQKREKLQAKADRMREKIPITCNIEKEKYKKQWQEEQDSVFQWHTQAEESLYGHQPTHGELLSSSLSARTLDGSDNGPKGELATPRIYAAMNCRKAFIPSQLPAPKRCQVETCTLFMVNCGCALKSNHCPKHLMCTACAKIDDPFYVRPCPKCKILFCGYCHECKRDWGNMQCSYHMKIPSSET